MIAPEVRLQVLCLFVATHSPFIGKDRALINFFLSAFRDMPPQGEVARQWFIPGEGIDRTVISADIQRYLGNDATVRPGVGTGEYQVRRHDVQEAPVYLPFPRV